MAIITADFEIGVDGNTIATSDTGSATAWDTVGIGAGGTAAYDDDASPYGTMAALLTRAGANVQLRWNTAFGTLTDHYGRFYMKPNSIVNVMQYFVCNAIANGAQTAWYLQTDTAGHLYIFDATFTLQATSTVTLTASQWVRLEYHAIHSTTAGQVEVKIFLSPDSTTPDETLATASNINTRAQGVEVEYCAQGPNNTYWFDNIVAADTAYPGPAEAAAPPTLRTVSSNLRW
jgi:hypothetical protein